MSPLSALHSGTSVIGRIVSPGDSAAGCKIGAESMNGQTDPGTDGYQIRPFSKDWPDEIKRLRDEVVAVLNQVSPFYLAPADAAGTALEGKVTAQVAPYGVKENDRH